MNLFQTAENFLGDRHMALPVRLPTGCQSLVDLLPYRAYDKADKLYINADSFGWFLELPPLIGGNDELVKVLSSAFAEMLPEGAYFQILHWTDPHTEGIFDLWAQPRRQRGDDVFKDIADRRCAYLAGSGWWSLFREAPFLTRRSRVFLACALAGQPSLKGIESLKNARRAIAGAFKSLTAAPQDVEPETFLNLIHRLIWPTANKERRPLSYKPCDPLHLQLIEPDADLSIVSGGLKWASGVEAAVMSAVAFPEFWPQWRNAELAGQENNDLMRPVCPVLTCFSFAVIDKVAATNRAFIRAAKATRKANSDFRRFWPDIVEQEREWKLTQSHLENGQALVQAGYSVAVMVPQDAEIEDAVQAVKSLYSAQGFRLERERNIHLQTFLSMLPHLPANQSKAGGRMTTMLTWSCANLGPIQGDWRGWVGDHQPGLLLFSRRGEPALWNPFDAKTGNFNIAVAGKSGSGKSVLMQELMASMVGAGAQVLVIDDGRSFEHSCKMLGGHFVEFSTTANICLNPFSAIEADILEADPNYREETLNMIIDMVCQACRPKEGTGDYERGIISKAVQQAWSQKGRAATLTTVRDCLRRVDDQRADDLAQMMADYCQGGLSARFFEGECTLKLKADLMVFELGELKSRDNLQSLVLMMIVFLGTQRMFRSARDHATAIIIDEAWDLLSSESSGKFIDGVARRARKHKGSLITGTQSVDDYYRTPAALAAFMNAETYFFLAQKSESINFLKKENRIDCDEEMERALKSLRKIDNRYSEFLMIDEAGWRLLRLILDPFSIAIFSSKGEDWQRVKKRLAAGETMHQAITQVAEQIAKEAA